MKEVYKFGIPALDEALGGGYVDGSIVLVEDEMGIPSEVLLAHFIVQGLRSGDDIIVLLSEHPISYYIALINLLGFNAEMAIKMGRLVFIDAMLNPFVAGKRVPYYSKYAVRNVGSISEVRQALQSAIQELKEPQKLRIVIDSLSQFLPPLVQNPQQVVIFLQQQMVERKERGGVFMALLHRDCHEPQIIKSVEYIVDSVISLERVKTEAGKPAEIILRFLKHDDLVLFEKLQNQSFIYKFEGGKLAVYEMGKIPLRTDLGW
ncbi:MAG: RAD55 family ATPase [Candidatus Baldrarchaeia archaeon]